MVGGSVVGISVLCGLVSIGVLGGLAGESVDGCSLDGGAVVGGLAGDSVVGGRVVGDKVVGVLVDGRELSGSLLGGSVVGVLVGSDMVCGLDCGSGFLLPPGCGWQRGGHLVVVLVG